MKRVALVAVLVTVACLCLNCLCVAGAIPEVKSFPPTKAGALALADQCIKDLTPKLTPKQTASANQVKLTVDLQHSVPTAQAQAIDGLVNLLTMDLAQTDGIEGVIVASAYLVKAAPANARVTNLLGVCLHSMGKNPEAVALFEYARTLAPKSELVMLNSANTFMELNHDDRAKAILDKVVAMDPKNRSAWSAIAGYWYKKGDRKQTMDALVKAAALGGWVVERKEEDNRQKVAENLICAGDSLEVADTKSGNLRDMVPKTAADLIEDQFPDIAQQIRDKYCRLVAREKMIMPPMPQMNTSGLKAWKTKGEPYLREWKNAFDENFQKAQDEIASLRGANISATDSQSVKDRKRENARRDQMKQQMADTLAAIQRMQNNPGVDPAKLAKIRAQMEKAAADMGVKPSTEPAGPGGSGGAGPAGAAQNPDAAGFGGAMDYGSAFAATNFRDFLHIWSAYHLYFMRWMEKYDRKISDIEIGYEKKHKETDEQANADLAELQRQYDNAGNDAARKQIEFKIRQRTLKWKKDVNKLGDYWLAQYTNLAFPEYAQKLKPKLDEFWAVCGLYIRNMNDPKTMKTQYLRVKQEWWGVAQCVVEWAGRPPEFIYMGETDEEERQLQADIQAAEADAQAKKDGYAQQTKRAETALEKWINDTFALGVSGEFLSLKITPRKLTVEELLGPGVGISVKHELDFKTGQWTTTRSLAAKLDVGIQVGPMKAGVSARADILESFDTLDIHTGQVVNSGGDFARASVSASGGIPNVSEAAGVTVTLDPAVENEWSVRGMTSVTSSAKAGDFKLSGKVL